MLEDGVYTVAPTPFDTDGSVHLASVETMTTALIDFGVQGLLVLGVMGEADRLLDEERDAILRRFISTADGAISIIAGTSHPSAFGAREFTKKAEAAGADAVMVSPPKLAKPNPEAVYEFFAEISSTTSIQVVIQDHPASSGVYLPIDLLTGLSRMSSVAAVKLEDPPTAPKVSSLLKATSGSVKVFGGLGGVSLIEELENGASGTMTGFAFPEILCDVWRLHASGDVEEARSLFHIHLPLILFEAQPLLSLPVRKLLYQRRGMISTPYVRAPAAGVDGGTLMELDRLVSGIELVWQR